jgi:hypothetical protein
MDLKIRHKKYLFHHKNVKAIELAIKLMMENVKKSYLSEFELNKSKFKDDKIKKSLILESRLVYTRILSGLLVSLSEEMLKRLLFEPKAFKEQQIIKIYEIRSLAVKWKTVFKIAFCNQFVKYDQNDPMYKRIEIPENEISIKKSTREKYKNVMLLLENEIFPMIDLRNKVQHGEWKYAFTPPNSFDYNENLTHELYKENIRTIQTKLNDIKVIYKMIKDLATFSINFKLNLELNPFEHFFDINYERIERNKKNLIDFDINKYIKFIEIRYEKGTKYKIINQK